MEDKYYMSSKMIKGMLETKFHQYQLENRLQDVNGIIDCLTTRTGEGAPHCIGICDNEFVGGNGYRTILKKYIKEATLSAEDNCIVLKNGKTIKLRKLTPYECMKLMGFDSNSTKSILDNGLNDSAIYHCVGDSIITPILSCIIGEMLDIDYKQKVKEYIERIIKDE